MGNVADGDSTGAKPAFWLVDEYPDGIPRPPGDFLVGYGQPEGYFGPGATDRCPVDKLCGRGRNGKDTRRSDTAPVADGAPSPGVTILTPAGRFAIDSTPERANPVGSPRGSRF